MRQNIDTSPINEMKNTITDVYLWKYESLDESLFIFGFLRSLLSSSYRKLNEISREHIVMSTNASTY